MLKRLEEIRDLARDDPSVAFARAWIELQKPSTFQEALERWRGDESGQATSVDELVTWFSGESSGTKGPSVEGAGALCLLTALDERLDQLELESHHRNVDRAHLEPIREQVEIAGETYRLVRRFDGWPTRISGPECFRSWTKRFEVVPFRSGAHAFEFVEPPLEPERGLEALTQGTVLRVCIGCFEALPKIELKHPTPSSFLVDPRKLDEDPKHWTAIERVLSAGKESGAQIIVLPELTVTPRLRARVARWLADQEPERLLLVLPGSFHELVGGDCFNRAELFGPRGVPLLAHDKISPFVGSLRRGQSSDNEAIKLGSAVRVLPTALGQIAVGICLDFCQTGSGRPALWESLGGGISLVASMSNKSSIGAHRRRAEDLERETGRRTALANQAVPPSSGTDGPVDFTGERPLAGFCAPLPPQDVEQLSEGGIDESLNSVQGAVWRIFELEISTIVHD